MAGIFHNRISIKSTPPVQKAENTNVVFNRIPTCQKAPTPAGLFKDAAEMSPDEQAIRQDERLKCVGVAREDERRAMGERIASDVQHAFTELQAAAAMEPNAQTFSFVMKLVNQLASVLRADGVPVQFKL